MWHEGHWAFFAVREDFIGNLVDEEVKTWDIVLDHKTKLRESLRLTYDQTLHLVLPKNLDAQRICYSIIVLERTASCRHDTQIFRS